jgi:hypothetical protein
MDDWAEVERFLQAEAEADLAAGAEMARPCLVALDGPALLFLGFLRPFGKGDHHAPITELLDLAVRLRADRLALAITARAWSLDDPIPPVADGVDLRQRVLMIERVAAPGAAGDHRSILIPFDDPVPETPVRWGERRELDGGEGWIADALRWAVSPAARTDVPADDTVAVLLAARADALGHLLAWGPETGERMVRTARALGFAIADDGGSAARGVPDSPAGLPAAAPPGRAGGGRPPRTGRRGVGGARRSRRGRSRRR